ncbi:MAG: hypothetical protein J6Y02_10795 [Pseudobutyrivibrio sp.]|nr:hypothetical protein [Pseudobutyrivibrio sp.]
MSRDIHWGDPYTEVYLAEKKRKQKIREKEAELTLLEKQYDRETQLESAQIIADAMAKTSQSSQPSGTITLTNEQFQQLLNATKSKDQ